MLTSSVPLKDFLWLGITVTFAKKVVRISNTCVQEVVVCFVVSQNARIVLVILRALKNQVGQQASSVILAVLSSGHKTVWTTILKPDFVLCISNAHRAPVQYHSIANHRCSKKRCSICSQYFDHSSQEVHECFVQRPKFNVTNASNTKVPGSSTQISNEREEEPLVDDACIWFFDIETEQSCNNRNEHVPVLLVVQNVEKLEHVFFGYDCVADFCASVFEGEARVREQEWFIAHFGSGFDFLPILQWLDKQQRFVPKILLRGNKVISMRVGNKRFIDSYLFIPIPLANFTETFGLKELRKGFFPHYLTSPEALAEPASALHSPCDCKATNGCHLQYRFSQDCYHCTEERRKKKSALPGQARSATFSFLPGEFPPPCLFGINSMKNGKNFEDFTLWHSLQRKNYEATSSVYNFRQELIEYCRSDVTLLREGVSEFRRLIRMSCQNIDPFQVACTAASACNYIYRQLFMPENSIGILPNNGYRCLDKTSFPACLWLEWVERRERKYGKEQRQSIEVFKSGVISNDKAKEGEQRLGPCKVDGLLVYKDDETGSGNSHRAKVLKFLGCYHHGCPQCYPDRLEKNKKRETSMGDLHLVSVEE